MRVGVLFALFSSAVTICIKPNTTGLFCASELTYEVSSVLSLLNADMMAQEFTRLSQACPFYRTKVYQCRKNFPKCIDEETLIKICLESCLNARTANDGLCSQSFSAAYFQNECSNSAYYASPPNCEKAPGDSPVDEDTVFKYVLVGGLALMAVLLLGSYFRQRMREQTLSPLELEETPRDFPKPRPRPRHAQVAPEEEEEEEVSHSSLDVDFQPPSETLNDPTSLHSGYAKLSNEQLQGSSEI